MMIMMIMKFHNDDDYDDHDDGEGNDYDWENNLVFTSFLFRILSIPSPLCLNYNFFIFMDFSDPGMYFF